MTVGAAWRQLPRPTGRTVRLRVDRTTESRLRAGHPWVFEGAIIDQRHDGETGSLAVVYDHNDRFLAVGLWDPNSPIRVRVLRHREPGPIDDELVASRIVEAADRRRSLPPQTDGYRVVHGPNDALPGVVVDRYAETAVLKLYSAVWLPWLDTLVDAIVERLEASRLVLRWARALDQTVADATGLDDGATLVGDPPRAPVCFRENGLRFLCDPVAGQKTGFFLDQRDNRARVEALADGRRTLNVFSYSGGFSLYAARGGAPHVTSLDLSAPALDDARANFAANAEVPTVAAAEHRCLVGDAFDELARLGDAGERFDLVVVDPPAFAKRAREIARARASYERLTELALATCAPGARIVLASCSSRVTPQEFAETVHGAAARVGRPLLDPEMTGHALDHPATFAEAAYLKAIFARVE